MSGSVPPPVAPSFVLVHGGRHGGWCWRHVAHRLRGRGHEVHVPTLTGMGDRHHLLSPSIGLQTHVDDLVALFEYEDLQDTVLVAHSYGGVPACGALDHIAARVRCLVLVDGQMPRTGESVMDSVGVERADALLERVATDGDGWYVPIVDATWWGLTDATDIAWVNARITPQPIRTYTEPVGSTERAWALPGTSIHCSPSRLSEGELARHRARATDDPHFHVLEVDQCHEVMITAPDDLSDLLIQAAARHARPGLSTA